MLNVGTKVRINEKCEEDKYIGLEGRIVDNSGLSFPYENCVKFGKEDDWFADWELNVLPDNYCMQL